MLKCESKAVNHKKIIQRTGIHIFQKVFKKERKRTG